MLSVSPAPSRKRFTNFSVTPNVMKMYDGGRIYVYDTWTTTSLVDCKVCAAQRSHATHLTAPLDRCARMLCQAVGLPHSSCRRRLRCRFDPRQAPDGPVTLYLHPVLLRWCRGVKRSRADAVDGCCSRCPARGPTPGTPRASPPVAAACGARCVFGCCPCG